MKSGLQLQAEQSRLEDELERSRCDLEDFFENGAVGLHWVASDGSILRANQAELDLLGYTREEYIGRQIADFHADQHVIQDILARLTRGERLDKYEARLTAKDGSIKHVLISSNVQFREGKFINTRCFTLDVTDLKKSESALRESEQRLRATQENAFAGIAEVDLTGRFLRANSRFSEITGYTADELMQKTFRDVTHPDDQTSDLAGFQALVAGAVDSYQSEKRFITKSGSQVWVELSASMVRDANRQPLYGIRVVQDITALKQAHERQKLLLDELNHRVKNMLATVQSVAMQTRRNATDLNEFTNAFNGRLMALNRAHELLTKEIGTGVLLGDLVRETLAPYENGFCGTLTMEGPDVRLGAEIAITFAMALHELATNAVKYGALSVEGGRIDATWRIIGPSEREPRRISVEWAEHGGPTVTQPSRRGFGSQLIEKGLARQLGGEASLEFGKSGLRCRIIAPLPA